MNYDLNTAIDPDFIVAQTQAAVSTPVALTQNVAGGAVTDIAGAQGSAITITGSDSSGWTISASGAGSQLTFSLSVTNAGTARTNLGIDEIATKKSNLSASAAPTVNDDSGDGYAVGSFWCDTTADNAYICLDATLGAAVWKIIT